MNLEHSPYEILGEEGVRNLAYAFYDVMTEDPSAKLIRDMHAEKLDEIKEKLFEYLTGWLGGPQRYAEHYGTVCLNEPHSHYHIGPQATEQWLGCMDKAIERIGADEQLKQALSKAFSHIAHGIQNQKDN